MSNILKGLLNEANPYRISEPEREYGAPFQSRPRMRPQEPEDVPDELPPQDPFKQDPAKLAKVEYSKDEGKAPNGERYNMVMSVSGPSSAVRNEVNLFKDHHWGAKKIVDVKAIEAKTPNGPAQYTVYIVDNHKYGMWTPFKGEKPVGEPLVFKEDQSGISASDLAEILYNRLEMRYPDIVRRYGHEVVGDAVMDVADFHAGAEELGTSDVGIMIRQILKKLENYNVDESKEQDYGPEFQDMVKRVGQLAKQGERKVVYDPVKRVYKTVPVNPPKEQGVEEARIHLTDPNAKINVYYIPPKLHREGKIQNLAHNIPYKLLEPLTQALMKKYSNIKPEYIVWHQVSKDPNAQYGERIEENQDTNQLDEKWSQKYKNSINCSHPKGFSQRAHCAGKKKHNESVEMEMVCEDCGMCETHADHQNLDEACWKGYHKEGNKKMFGKTYPNCVKNESVAEGNDPYKPDAHDEFASDTHYDDPKDDKDIAEEKCPHCGGPMFSEMIMNEKKDACYYKVKSRYKVWPSAYASGALVKCRKKGAANWGNSSKNESVSEEQVDETLRDWFKEKWVRFGPDGKIRGACARGDDSEGKPKCLPQSKAHALGKKGRASAAARKRREDPNPERHGKAINVNTKKKSNEGVAEEFELAGVGVAYELGRRAYKQGMTIRDNPYSATKEARKYDEWEKGLERGKWDAIEARKFRNKFNESELKDKKDLDAKRKALQDMEREPGHDKEAIRQRKLDLEKEARSKGIKESAILKGLLG